MPGGEFIEDLLLKDFGDVLDKHAQALFDNVEYMKLYELRVLLKLIREQTSVQLFQAYSRPDQLNIITKDGAAAADACAVAVGSVEASGGKASNAKSKAVKPSAASTASAKPEGINPTIDSVQRSRTDRQLLSDRLRQLDEALRRHDAYVQARLDLCASQNERHPRILLLCEGYHFSPGEAHLFQLMVVVQGSSNPHCLNTLNEDSGDYMRRVANLMKLSGNSDVMIDLFCDPERPHIREGLVTLDEDNGIHFNLKVPRTAVQLLYGRPVRRDDLLKVYLSILILACHSRPNIPE